MASWRVSWDDLTVTGPTWDEGEGLVLRASYVSDGTACWSLALEPNAGETTLQARMTAPEVLRDCLLAITDNEHRQGTSGMKVRLHCVSREGRLRWRVEEQVVAHLVLHDGLLTLEHLDHPGCPESGPLLRAHRHRLVDGAILASWDLPLTDEMRTLLRRGGGFLARLVEGPDGPVARIIYYGDEPIEEEHPLR